MAQEISKAAQEAPQVGRRGLGQQRRRLLRLPAVASQLPIQMPPRRAQVAVTSEQADLPAQRFAEAAPS